MNEQAIIAENPTNAPPSVRWLAWLTPGKRFMAVARYLPAGLAILLVVAWIVSLFVSSAIWIGLPNGYLSLHSDWGRIGFRHDWDAVLKHNVTFVNVRVHEAGVLSRSWLGDCGVSVRSDVRYVAVPIPLLLTVLFPLAIGCLIHFRFPLWSWFAWTALVGLELMHYAPRSFVEW